jgi:hypothetical protein
MAAILTEMKDALPKDMPPQEIVRFALKHLPEFGNRLAEGQPLSKAIQELAGDIGADAGSQKGNATIPLAGDLVGGTIGRSRAENIIKKHASEIDAMAAGFNLSAIPQLIAEHGAELGSIAMKMSPSQLQGLMPMVAGALQNPQALEQMLAGLPAMLETLTKISAPAPELQPAPAPAAADASPALTGKALNDRMAAINSVARDARLPSELTAIRDYMAEAKLPVEAGGKLSEKEHAALVNYHSKASIDPDIAKKADALGATLNAPKTQDDYSRQQAGDIIFQMPNKFRPFTIMKKLF